MSPDDLELPVDLAELRALLASTQARLAASEQALETERSAHGVPLPEETWESIVACARSVGAADL